MTTACTSYFPAPYEIEDAGHLLIGLSTSRIPDLHSFEVSMRKVGSNPLTGTRLVVRLCKAVASGECDAPDYHDDSKLGVAVARRMPTGRYYVTGVRAVILHRNGGFGFHSLETKKNLKIPFEITSGESSYLGRYHIDQYLPAKNTHSFDAGQAIIGLDNQPQLDWQIAQRNMHALYSTMNSYLPNQEASLKMQTMSERKPIRKAYKIRSEKPTDGKESGSCVWWCQ